MSYNMQKLGEDHNLADMDGSGFNFERPSSRRWRAFRLPIYILSCVLGVVLLSQIVPKSHSAEQAEKAILSKAQSILVSRPSASASWVRAENITHSKSTLEDALFYPSNSWVTSPNKKFRLSFPEDGELLLETAAPTKGAKKEWSPIWWANSASYATKLKDGKQYVALDPSGDLQVVRWVADGPKKFRKTHPWMSSMQRECGDHIDQKELAKSLKDTPKPQSLALDDTGRIIVFNATAHAVCIIADSYGAMHIPRGEVNMTTTEQPYVKGEFPPIMNSDKYSNHQLRAMLEADVKKQNMTFELNSTQLETIYDTAIILPSWHGHKDAAVKFLRSMIRNCVDCDRWSINIVAATEDMHFFQKHLYDNGDQSLRYWLPGLRILEYEHLAFPHYDDDIDVAQETVKQSKNVLQNFKKNYGCLATGKKYCSLLDSEGIVLRTTWYVDIVKEYLDAPFVIHNPDGQNADDNTPYIGPLKEMMSMPNLGKAGWLLEYYMWVMDASVFDAVADIIAKKHPTASDFPQQYFVEMAYYAYIWGQLGPVPGPAYTWITAQEILGDRLYNLTWHRYVDEDPETRHKDFRAILEDVRVWIERYPEMCVPAAQRWDQMGLRYYKAMHDDYSFINMAFLSVAKSVRMAVSDQPLGLYEAAMAGVLN
ncbi:hypothetical protein MBLNU457_4270t1 [Dothideomycetes sp. NU457]